MNSKNIAMSGLQDPLLDRNSAGNRGSMGGKGAKLKAQLWDDAEPELQVARQFGTMAAKPARPQWDDFKPEPLPIPSESEPPAATAVLNRPRNLVPLAVLLARAAISRSYFYVLRKAGRAPQSIKFDKGRRGAIRFVESEVDDWIDNMIANRNVPSTSASTESQSGTGRHA